MKTGKAYIIGTFDTKGGELNFIDYFQLIFKVHDYRFRTFRLKNIIEIA